MRRGKTTWVAMTTSNLSQLLAGKLYSCYLSYCTSFLPFRHWWEKKRLRQLVLWLWRFLSGVARLAELVRC